MPNLYSHLVPTPPRESMNTGHSPARVVTLEACFGDFPHLPTDCGECRNHKVSALLESRNVGPFKVTMIRPALDALERALKKLKTAHPELYKMLGTEGGMCYRRVRGASTPSNHAAGTAIDFNVGGVLPEMDTTPETPALIPNGFVILYGFLHGEGFAWGAGYRSRADSMHWEISDETLRAWKAEGKI